MKILLYIQAAVVFALLFASCTENSRARSFGGTMTVDLPKGEKLVTATWKEASLWYLTRQMREDESPETYSFQESSPFGIAQGTVIFNERAK